MSRYHDRHRLRDLRDDRRGHYDPRKPARKGQAGKVLAILAVVAVAGIVASRMGCRAEQSAQTLPPKKALAGLKPKDLQQQTAEYGIEGGAIAAKGYLEAANQLTDITGELPPPEAEQTDAGFVVRKVRSPRPHVLPANRAEAIREAEGVARQALVQKGYLPTSTTDWKVSYQPNGVHDVPPPKSVVDEWEAKKWGPAPGWVEIEEVTVSHEAARAEWSKAHETERAERARDRAAQAGFWFGTAFLGLLAAYGFLRLDMWTKGYLTLVLGIVVGAVVVAAVVGLAVLVL